MQNARVLFDTESKHCAVIDPGGDVEVLMDAILTLDFFVEYIFLTHAHLDHGGGIAELIKLLTKLQKKPPIFVAHSNEAFVRATLSEQALMFGLSPKEYPNIPEPDVLVEDEAEFMLGKYKLKCFHTPGHSPGHIVIAITNTKDNSENWRLISGDVLFAGSIGRTDLPGGDFNSLMRSIKDKILTMPDNTIVMSGHGPDTTIGQERVYNPFLNGDYV